MVISIIKNKQFFTTIVVCAGSKLGCILRIKTPFLAQYDSDIFYISDINNFNLDIEHFDWLKYNIIVNL